MKREKQYKVQFSTNTEVYKDLNTALRRFREIDESPKKIIELTNISERVIRKK